MMKYASRLLRVPHCLAGLVTFGFGYTPWLEPAQVVDRYRPHRT